MIAPSSPHTAVDAMLDLRPLSAAIGVELDGRGFVVAAGQSAGYGVPPRAEEHCAARAPAGAVRGSAA